MTYPECDVAGEEEEEAVEAGEAEDAGRGAPQRRHRGPTVLDDGRVTPHRRVIVHHCVCQWPKNSQSHPFFVVLVDDRGVQWVK